MKVVKIIPNKFSKASRDMREVTTYMDLGFDVVIISKKDIDNLSEYNGSVTLIEKKISDRKDYKIIKALKRFVTLLSWPVTINKLNPDLISGHDIYGLLIAYLSTIFKRKKNKPKLIYDSHEFELGRAGKSGRFRKWLIYHLEKYLIKRSDLVIMVNDSIAERVQSIYHLQAKPLVIRNVPEYWHLDNQVIQEKRSKLLRLFKKKSIDFIVMHHGVISKYRGIDNVLEALTQHENIGMVILGNGPKKDIEDLKVKARELNIMDRVVFHPAVDIDELWQYVGATDVGIMTIPAVSESYYYGLPNKLFENIQGLTPVIGTHYPEMKKIIEGYDIGISVDPNNVLAISEAIKTMRENKEMYAKFKKNLLKAKEELHWGNEKKKLLDSMNMLILK